VQKPLSRAAYLHGFHGVGAPLSEQSETSTFINRAPNIPTGVMSVYRNEIDTLYAALKSFGLLQYLDALYMLAGPDNDTTLLSLTTPGGGVSGYTVANYKLSRTGSPIFTANSGWSGDGSTSDYLSTGINLSTAPALKASQNSMHMGAWFLTANPGAGATSSYDVGCAGSAIGINGAGYFQGQPNYGSPKTMSAAAAAPGHIMWNRTASGAWAAFKDGVAGPTGTDTSAAFQNRNLQLGYASGLLAGVNNLMAFHFGGAFNVNTNQNDALNMRTCLHNFGVAIGALSS